MRLWLLSILALATGLTSARADRVDDYLASEMASHRIPGACLLVVQTNTTVKRASYGLANIELKVPVTAETVFEIGSLTETVYRRVYPVTGAGREALSR